MVFFQSKVLGICFQYDGIFTEEAVRQKRLDDLHMHIVAAWWLLRYPEGLSASLKDCVGDMSWKGLIVVRPFHDMPNHLHAL